MPGIVGTAMWDLIDEELEKKSSATKGDTVDKRSQELNALGRISVPEDVSKTIRYLTSPDPGFMIRWRDCFQLGP